MAWWEGQRPPILKLPSGKNCTAQHSTSCPAECAMTIHCEGAAYRRGVHTKGCFTLTIYIMHSAPDQTVWKYINGG